MPAAKKLKPRVKSDLSLRICEFINDRYDGSVLAAANALNIPYDSLRHQALGMAVRPNVTVARKLAEVTGKGIEWWLA